MALATSRRHVVSRRDDFYRLPRQHHKHLKSTNLLERFNKEITRCTGVVRLFPNPASCLRLVRTLCAETHEGQLEDHRYVNTDFLKEQKKNLLHARRANHIFATFYGGC